MKIRKNDKVIVLRGKDKGKTGLVVRAFPNKQQVLVEGVNQFKKHQKGEAKGRGELITITKPLNVSKVMLIDPTTDKPSKVGFIIEDGKKYRVAKKSGTKLTHTIESTKIDNVKELTTKKGKDKKGKEEKNSKKQTEVKNNEEKSSKKTKKED